jgi:hypothetical protein
METRLKSPSKSESQNRKSDIAHFEGSIPSQAVSPVKSHSETDLRSELRSENRFPRRTVPQRRSLTRQKFLNTSQRVNHGGFRTPSVLAASYVTTFSPGLFCPTAASKVLEMHETTCTGSARRDRLPQEFATPQRRRVGPGADRTSTMIRLLR